MAGQFFLIPMLLIIGASYLVVRAASVMLMMTGLEERRARFQALSAFTGTGFTTKEAELIVNHPQRRKIVTWLMILGNAGFATVIVTATSSLVTSEGYHIGITAFLLVFGVFLVYKIVSRNALVRRWEGFIKHKLMKTDTAYDEAPMEDLLRMGEGYGLIRIRVPVDSSLIGSQIEELKKKGSRFWIFGLERGSKWMPVPSEQEIIKAKDRYIVYGPLSELDKVFRKGVVL